MYWCSRNPLKFHPFSQLLDLRRQPLWTVLTPNKIGFIHQEMYTWPIHVMYSFTFLQFNALICFEKVFHEVDSASFQPQGGSAAIPEKRLLSYITKLCNRKKMISQVSFQSLRKGLLSNITNPCNTIYVTVQKMPWLDWRWTCLFIIVLWSKTQYHSKLRFMSNIANVWIDCSVVLCLIVDVGYINIAETLFDI